MPELPEVETIRRQLAPRLEGRRIVRLAIHDPRWCEPAAPAEVVAAVRAAHRGATPAGQVLRLRAVRRHAPALAPADDRDAALRPGPAAAGGARRPRLDDGPRWPSGPPPVRHRPARARPRGAGGVLRGAPGRGAAGRRLHRRAPARAGARVSRAGQGHAAGPEAHRRRREHLRRRGAVPRPHPPATRGRPPQPPPDGGAARRGSRVAEAGIAHGGATIDDYRDPDGGRGGFQDEFLVHRRAGEPCPRCGTPIVKLVAAGRGTYVCPRCQPRPRPRRMRR